MKDLIASFKILEKKGLPIARYKLVNNEEDLDMEYPAYLKINSPEHKAKLGGVKKVKNLDEAKKALKQLKKIADEIVLQEAVSGKEIIIGLEEDEVFEKVLLIGLGGRHLGEKRVVFRVPPVSKQEVLDALKELGIYEEVKELNLSKLVKIVRKAATLNVKEADLNPVIVNKQQALIVDARIELA
ncbi:MAG: acetate--CoA ligase family protein [Candidatus Nanoarchaeia archaeon]